MRFQNLKGHFRTFLALFVTDFAANVTFDLDLQGPYEELLANVQYRLIPIIHLSTYSLMSYVKGYMIKLFI
jgi:hypothetical protein